MQKNSLLFSFILLLSFLIIATHNVSAEKGRRILAQEENIIVPGINEALIEKNNDVALLSPNYGSIFALNEEILISWGNRNIEREYIFTVYFYYLEGDFHFGHSAVNIDLEEKIVLPFQKSVIALQVYYYDKEFYYTDQRDQNTYVTDILVLGIGMDIPEYWYKRFYKEKVPTITPPVIEENKKEDIEKEIVAPFQQEQTQQVKKRDPKPKKIETITNEPEKFEWNFIQQEDVKGSQAKKTECRYKYLYRYNQGTKIECNIPKLENITAEVVDRGTYKDLIVKGNIYRDIFVQIDIYTCDSSFFKPITWFECKEKYLETKYLHIYPNIHMSITIDGRKYPLIAFSLSRNEFSLLSQISKLEKIKNVEVEYLAFFKISDYNIFENSKRKYQAEVKEPKIEDSTEKPFSFPFSSIVGVSQWHGYTEYQKPHTGIDFSTVKRNTLAIGNGLVIGKGWDNYYGKCLSGGNYLTVKHDNGMHSVYFHLDESFTDVGKRVNRGDIVARTGNSGYWNCQPLAHHLHFELRENKLQSSHVNPVEYIEQDWSKIPTVGYKQNPGRLSGDNPHPGS